MSQRKAWHPPEYGLPDIRAVQALGLYAQEAERPSANGEAAQPPSPAEAKRALDWIIKHAAGTYDDPFEAGQPDVVAYMLGRRSVGLAIVKMMTLKPSIFDKEKV